MSNWTCPKCQYTYHPEQGDIKQGIMQGTAWSELPEDWTCPKCHTPKFEFSQFGLGGSAGSGWTVT